MPKHTPDVGPALAAELDAVVEVVEKHKKKKKKTAKAKPTAKASKPAKPAKVYPERDVQTWLRLTSRNLYTRKQQQDVKSNILLSINALMLTLAAGSVYPSLASYPHLLWSMFPMGVSNVVSALFAVSAMRPRISGTGRFTEEDVADHTARLVTFDDFYQMSEEQYEDAILKVLRSQDFIYRSMIKDIYQLGIDEAQRYRDLRRAYMVFVVGIIVTVSTFGLCHLGRLYELL
jgi:hypothetical protein